MRRTGSAGPLWLGVDLGTQSARAVVVDDAGLVRGTGVHPLESVRVGDRHGQDPESWWTATRRAIVAATSDLEGRDVRGLSVASTSGSLTVVDSAGRPTTAGIMYDDLRGRDLLPLVDDAGADVWSGSAYRMQASWALPKIVWLQRQGLLVDGATVVHQGDLVLRRLAGRPLPTDTSTALKAGVDLTTGDWPRAVFDGLGIPPEAMPDLVDPGTVVGEVDPAVASTLGLGSDCMLVAGMTDGCAAQIAAGAVADGQWNTVMGTTMVVKGVSERLIGDPNGSVYSHRAPFGGGWFSGGASNTGTRAFQHWVPERSPETVGAALARHPDPPLIYPLAGNGERFPFVDDRASATFEPRFEQAGAMERHAAIAVGIAYLERLAYDSLSALGFRIDGPIGLTGGGARSAAWNQLRSDVLGRPVAVADNTEGAVGVAILAAAAMSNGEPADSRLATTAARMLRAGPMLDPRPDEARRHDDGYRRFLAMLGGNRIGEAAPL